MKTTEKQIGHTPGPWKWDGDDLWHSGEDYNDASDPHQYTGIRSDARLRESKTLEANRLLIAAAPELLDACLSCLPSWGEEDDGDGLDGTVSHEISLGDLRKLRAAIAKAVGGGR